MNSLGILGLVGIGVAGVGSAIMLFASSLTGHADLKQSNEAATLLNSRTSELNVVTQKKIVQQMAEDLRVNLTLNKGDTLLSILADAGVSNGDAYAARDSLKEMIDLRSLKVGQRISLGFRTVREAPADRRLENLAMIPETDRLVVVKRIADQSFNAISRPIKHEVDLIPASGRITTSLYEAARIQGVPISVLLQTYGVLGHAVDFQRDIRSGDRFDIGYVSFDDGTLGGKHSGKLVYISLRLGDRTQSYFRHKTKDGFTGFFDISGNSVQTSLLKTPVDGGRLSSLFGKRKHPILGYTRMHKGLDFAAPLGTPVLAAGDGVITARELKGSFGKYVSIRHDNQYSTSYAHLSKYEDSIKPGRLVRQGDVIGYVGSTGLATGPNLHYEVQRDGKSVNPIAIDLPSQRVLTDNELTRFRQAAKQLLSKLDISISKFEALNETSLQETGSGSG